MPVTQDSRVLAVDTPLGPDALILRAVEGEEGVSRPFRFTLVMESEAASIDPAAVLGKPARVTIALPSGGERLVHGLVSRFRQAGSVEAHVRYEAELVPWLWMLSLSMDCRIYQHLSVPEIVTAVFDELGYEDYRLQLVRSYPPREFCVQYRETHLDFVSRLLEDEGILYFFEHEAERHRLVLADHPAMMPACPGLPELREAPTGSAVWRDDVYTSLAIDRAVRTRAVALADYSYLAPSASLVTSLASDGGAPEAFDYPGGYVELAEGERYARLRLEAVEAGETTARGASRAPALTSGCKVVLTHGALGASGGEWLVVGVAHAARSGTLLAGDVGAAAGFAYDNTFTLAPADLPWRPPRRTPRPRVHGTQSALVVGPKGAEIHTDAHGRVKLHFHWDRRSRRDDTSSCWVRCSMAWAGQGWGQFSVPRIGQEVLVDFLEGDPDRPVVVGRVYNAEQTPPCDPAGSAGAVSGMRSKTHGGSGYNAMTMDDTAGAELITIHGQYDMDTTVQHDERVTIGHDRTERVGNHETITIEANRTETVGGNETGTVGGSRAWQVGSSDALTVGGSRTETVALASAETVGAAKALSIGAAYQISVGGVLNATVGGAMIEEIGAFRSIGVARKFNLEAGDEITLKCGSASLTMRKNGDIVIKGAKITITGSGDVVVKGSKIAAN